MEQVFQAYVKEVKYEGKSVFLSSHILSEVEKLCDRVSIIRQGKIIETGTLNELRHLTSTNIVVNTKEPIQGLEAFAQVKDLREENHGTAFNVSTESVGEVVEYLTKFGIQNLEAAPPTLEELFMSHYKEEV